jgi:hypothetical protein
MTTQQKYIWLALCALGIGILMSTGQPVPKKPTTVLRSPKATPARVLVLPVTVPHVNRFYLAWDNSNTVPVGFVVEYRTDLLMPWFPLGTVTNATRWPLNSFRESTNRTEYFRVGAFLP